MIQPIISVILDMEPPTVTHQDKELGWRSKAGGGKRPSIRDSKALAQAIETYGQYLRTAKGRPRQPVKPADDCELAVRLVFCWKGEPNKIELWPQKPDFDNAAKTLVDAMAQAEYIHDDKAIVRAEVWKARAPRGFVSIELFNTGLAPINDVFTRVNPNWVVE